MTITRILHDANYPDPKTESIITNLEAAEAQHQAEISKWNRVTTRRRFKEAVRVHNENPSKENFERLKKLGSLEEQLAANRPLHRAAKRSHSHWLANELQPAIKPIIEHVCDLADATIAAEEQRRRVFCDTLGVPYEDDSAMRDLKALVARHRPNIGLHSLRSLLN